MNWYVKYRVEFTDDLGVDWKVHIKKQAASAFTIVDYQGTGDPLVFEAYGDDDPFMQRVQGSRVNIGIWCPNDFELLDLFSANIQEFQVVVYQDNNLFWKGYVLPGIYQEAYNQAPLQVSISASDGLGLLKEFQFIDLGYGSDRQKFVKVIYDILELIEITQFKEFINLYSSNMDDDTDDSPLDQVGLDPVLFKTANCYDALVEILKMFNAGIKQDMGEIVIYRFVEVLSSMHGRKFTSATVKTHITNNPDQFINRVGQPSKIRDIEGGTLTMIPQASDHIINYDLGLKESALKNWDFQFDDFELDGTWSIPHWELNNCSIYPLSDYQAGDDLGIYIKHDGVSSNPYIYQQIENVKTRSPRFRLSFDYRINNTGTAKTGVIVNYRLTLYGSLTTYYWNAAASAWTTSSASASGTVFFGDIPATQWGEWVTKEIEIDGVPIDGDLELKLYSASYVWGTVYVAYRDVKLVMTPLQGGSDTGIGYTYPSATMGRIIEHENRLGDGFTVARHAVNQVVSYAGIVNMYSGSTILDPLTSGGAVWATRGGSEDKTIYEVINSEMGRQYERPRQLIDLPVWVKDPTVFISGVGNIQDSLNKVGGNNRKFHVGIRSFNAKTRDYQLVLSELI